MREMIKVIDVVKTVEYYEGEVKKYNRQLYNGNVVGSQVWENGSVVIKYFDKEFSKTIENKAEFYEKKIKEIYEEYPEYFI